MSDSLTLYHTIIDMILSRSLEISVTNPHQGSSGKEAVAFSFSLHSPSKTSNGLLDGEFNSLNRNCQSIFGAGFGRVLIILTKLTFIFDIQ